MVNYDPKHPTESKLQHALGYFMQYEATKDLVRDHFVIALGKCASRGAWQFVPKDEPLEKCLLLVTTPDGKVLRREGVYGNPDEGLKRTKAVLEEWRKMESGPR